jgi:hypothetical protein
LDSSIKNTPILAVYILFLSPKHSGGLTFENFLPLASCLLPLASCLLPLADTRVGTHRIHADVAQGLGAKGFNMEIIGPDNAHRFEVCPCVVSPHVGSVLMSVLMSGAPDVCPYFHLRLFRR